jgi:hypothetical protein
VVAEPDERTVAILEGALAAVPAGATDARARLIARLATEVLYADPDRADALSTEALALARDGSDWSAVAFALSARRGAIWEPVRAAERLRVSEEMVSAARQNDDAESLLQAQNWRVVDLMELGRVEELEDQIDAYEQPAAELGLPHYSRYVPLWRGAVAGLRGDFEIPTAHRAEALRLGRQAQSRDVDMHVLVQEISALADSDKFEGVDLDEARRRAASSPLWRPWSSWPLAKRGKLDEAREIWDDDVSSGIPEAGTGPN